MKFFTIKNKKHINILLILLAIIAGLLILLVLKHIFFNKIKIIEANTGADDTSSSDSSSLEQNIKNLWNSLKSVIDDAGTDAASDASDASDASAGAAGGASGASGAAASGAAASGAAASGAAGAAASGGAAGAASAAAGAAAASAASGASAGAGAGAAAASKTPKLTPAQKKALFIKKYEDKNGKPPSAKTMQIYNNDAAYTACSKTYESTVMGLQCSNANNFVSVTGKQTALSPEQISTADAQRSKTLNLVSFKS